MLKETACLFVVCLTTWPGAQEVQPGDKNSKTKCHNCIVRDREDILMIVCSFDERKNYDNF
jgi:hypothetical protein